MKKVQYIVIIAFAMILGMNSSNAQNPSFIVDWNPCDLQITGSEYYVQYAIYNTTTSTFVVPATWYGTHFPHTDLSGTVVVDSWDCNQMDTKPYLYIYVNVELRKDGVTYCTGSARSSLLTCGEMYNDATTITVNMLQ